MSWESGTNLLTDIEKHVTYDGDEVLVEKLRSIDYRDRLPDLLFTVEVPRGVRLTAYAEPRSNAYADLGPVEVTEVVLEAWKHRQWNRIRPFCDSEALIAWMRTERLVEFTITGPPEGANYAGYKVPCELVFNGLLGTRSRHTHLALRNDNRMERYVYDGGL